MRTGEHHLEDIEMKLRSWVDGVKGVGEPWQPILAEQENILDSLIAKPVQVGVPEACILIGARPESQYLLAALEVDPDGQVNGALLIAIGTVELDMDCIHIDDWVQGL
jgi:hypothetical protein